MIFQGEFVNYRTNSPPRKTRRKFRSNVSANVQIWVCRWLKNQDCRGRRPRRPDINPIRFVIGQGLFAGRRGRRPLHLVDVPLTDKPQFIHSKAKKHRTAYEAVRCFGSLYTKPRSGYLGVPSYYLGGDHGQGSSIYTVSETAYGCADNSTLIWDSIKHVPWWDRPAWGTGWIA